MFFVSAEFSLFVAKIGNSWLSKINLISELEARVKAQEAQMQRQYARMNANNTAGQIG